MRFRYFYFDYSVVLYRLDCIPISSIPCLHTRQYRNLGIHIPIIYISMRGLRLQSVQTESGSVQQAEHPQWDFLPVTLAFARTDIDYISSLTLGYLVQNTETPFVVQDEVT